MVSGSDSICLLIRPQRTKIQALKLTFASLCVCVIELSCLHLGDSRTGFDNWLTPYKILEMQA